MTRLPPREDLPPPIGVGGGGPFARVDVLVGRDVAIHCQSRLAAHQLAGSVAGYASTAFVLVPVVLHPLYRDLETTIERG
jgi:hypothetical protein